MTLVRLIYSSHVSADFSVASIDRLVECSKANNRSDGITGVLCFNNRYFLQCLEGQRDNVNQTYRRIVADSRHQDVSILSYQEITERAFADWEMGYVPYTKALAPVQLKYSGNTNFDPSTMSGESCFKLLNELKHSVSLV